ncbi:MAG TPA: acetyl-CoA carboxylase carboxyltransferase subunit alpha/beta [Chloroflexota bacterium]|nr:acetyl-CoA carboxylase carboxyltransferase subunit alpha/beta [Chloroflexota bacterium]
MTDTSISDPTVCPRCSASLESGPLFRRYRVCDSCNFHLQIPARRRLELIADEGSFREVNQRLAGGDPLTFADLVPYLDRLNQARERTGIDEAVITGTARINGLQCVLAISEFEFMGGSMGSAVGEKVALAMELAMSKRLPFVSVAASGGARMQEGMLSLVQMAKTAATAMRLHKSAVPFISVLTDPTTGGVYASYASQGDVLIAESGALVGFAGPRVIEQLTGHAIPPNAQTAELLFEQGQIDAVVERPKLRGLLAMLIQILHRPWDLKPRGDVELYRPTPAPPASAWQAVELARHDQRPTASDYIRHMMPLFVELHGDRFYGDDPAVITGVGDLGGITCVVIAQERGHGEESERRRGGKMRPEGYRKAERMMRLATDLNLPLITLIDTPGASLDFDSEARGLAPSISNCLAQMSITPVPVIAAVIGEGGSGGALALGLADRILMQENAIYSVIAPEGAAAILYHDAHKAADVADALKLSAADASVLGVVDTLVPEPAGGAHLDQDYAAVLLRNFILDALIELRKLSPSKLLDERYRKFRRMGQVSERRDGFTHELEEIQKRFAQAFDHIRYRFPSRHAEPDRSGDSQPKDGASSEVLVHVEPVDQPR